MFDACFNKWLGFDVLLGRDEEAFDFESLDGHGGKSRIAQAR